MRTARHSSPNQAVVPVAAGRATTPNFPRKRLAALLGALLASAIPLGFASPAAAQQVVIGPGNSQGRTQNVVGSPGTPGGGSEDSPQAGGPGNNPGTLGLELQGGAVVSGSGGSPTLDFNLSGGMGGQGHESKGGDSTGTRGADGGAGSTNDGLTFNLDAGSTVNSATTGVAAVRVTNTGGAGGFPGTYPANYGYSGLPGIGGDSGTIQANLQGAVDSTNGWNGPTPGATALLIRATGGSGTYDPNDGNSGVDRQGAISITGSAGTRGGDADTITITGGGVTLHSAGAGMVVVSQGGRGSDGTSAVVDFLGTGNGGAGGPGGNGGDIGVTLGDQTRVSGITAVGASTAATGVTLPVSDDGKTVAQAAYLAAGLQVQSFGGLGGAGGSADGSAGTGGAGGDAGSAGNLALTYSNGNITTTGFAAAGMVAQTVGGAGGSGASPGGVFGKKGGGGGKGGDGGAITVDVFDWNGATTHSLLQTSGDDSTGIVAQSIGGGGGVGGSVTVNSVLAGVSIGGVGESGGTGGVVTLNNGGGTDPDKKADQGIVISTSGDRSTGLVAQSIGGGGGMGGSAQSTAFGPFSLAVGGDGGSGGDAGTPGTNQVTVENAGIVQTFGHHSRGIDAQAIGGGGGSGGSGSSLTASAQINVTVAVGGSGGAGGKAGDVKVTNDGQAITMGADAMGIDAQSIGGGGGNGGASKADGFQLVNADDVPSFNFSTSIGGSGGGGGNGGNVTVDNDFAVMTNGTGSHGIVAQSIGGGGGNGGDSSSIQSGYTGSTFAINLALGGKGGVGGSGDTVTVNNDSLVWTLGAGSDGVVAQSIGGGGGNGGVGFADTGAYKSDSGSTFAISVGGAGGNGNTGNTATVNNTGGILTRGDDARGIFAQSIGGGGGNGAGSTAHGTGGTVTIDVAVGGNGGTGNTGGQVVVNNGSNTGPAGAIMTQGADSAAIYAQSIGGGGGAGGHAAVGSGTDPSKTIASYLETSTGISSLVQHYATANNTGGGSNGGVANAASGSNDIYGFAQGAASTFNSLKQLSIISGDYEKNNADASSPTDGAGDGNYTVTLNVGGGFGGKGGSGGDADEVTITNYANGQIQTLGPRSDGIFAQMIGGGGGDGGTVVVSTDPSKTPTDLTANVSVGGSAGAGGKGGDSLTTNFGSITTSGDQSHGIFVQSVGGGGGTGAITQSSSPTAVHDFTMTLGGDGGSNGDGGNITVLSASDNGPAPTVTTHGDDAVGIAAQSVGGGGGMASIMHTVIDSSTGNVASASSQAIDKTPVDLQFGARESYNCSTFVTAACGDGGHVSIVAQDVTTSGRNAYGLLAQSIGGGGGWLVGGTVSGTDLFSTFVKGAATEGAGGSVFAGAYGRISTSGAGAMGIVAQSVGGGGVLAGDTATGTGPIVTGFTPVTSIASNVGDGANVSVTVASIGSVATTGDGAHAIFAQSVGGGGGLYTSSDHGTVIGTAGGDGQGGQISVDVAGSVSTLGKNASGVFVNSAGTTTEKNPPANPVTVTVASTGSISSAQSPAIVIDSNATSNTVTNAGTITSAILHPAVLALNGAVNANNSGTITGDLNLRGGSFTNSGTWTPLFITAASTVTNPGTLVLGAATASEPYPAVTIDGDLASTGKIRTAVDFTGKQASSLHVYGMANVSGTILVDPVTMSHQTVGFVTATNGLTLGPLTAQDQSQYLYQYTLSQSGNTLNVTPNANMTAVAQTEKLSSSEQSMANHLQTSFNADAPNDLGDAFAQLTKVGNRADYKKALDTMSNEALNAVGSAQLAASQDFVLRMNDCRDDHPIAERSTERDCAWGHVFGTRTERKAANDAVGYGVNSQTMQIGGQRQVADGWFVGGSAAYVDNTFGADDVSAHVGGRGGALGAFVKHQSDRWTVSGAVDAGFMRYHSSRSLALGDIADTATAGFSGENVGLHSRVAYTMPIGNAYLKPYVDLSAIYLHTGRYTETGAKALDLEVDGSSDTRFGASPMLEVGTQVEHGDVTLRPFLGIGASLQNDNDWKTRARFEGSPGTADAFETTSRLPSSALMVNAGVTLFTTHNIEARAEYVGRLASGFKSNTASLKFSMGF